MLHRTYYYEAAAALAIHASVLTQVEANYKFYSQHLPSMAGHVPTAMNLKGCVCWVVC